ncbi:toll-Interleukin receptor [Hymenobacter sp. B81]|uniref:toll-Interleukin receptor n=1 Tax=Hymenobacter sp. B81 TaxID=3344878 RepID=UPI0037DD0FEF
MALFTEQQLINRVSRQQITGLAGYDMSRKAQVLLSKTRNFQNTPQGRLKSYDIFLSHSTNDAQKVAGLKLLLEDMGYSVYVDWIEDPQLDRTNVTKDTAAVLRGRMHTCRSLFYAFSEHSGGSKWMPWELGYFDGIKQMAAVLPIRAGSTASDSFQGTEYLGLYHYITVGDDTTGRRGLWVRESVTKYIVYEEWLKSSQPIQR